MVRGGELKLVVEKWRFACSRVFGCALITGGQSANHRQPAFRDTLLTSQHQPFLNYLPRLMSAPLPQHTKSIHLLRALLRESTYLPDAHARQYFRRYIVARFKAYQPKQNATASYAVQALERYRHRAFKRRQLSVIVERASKLQRKAQKGLHYLRRANQGELLCLRKVLLFTYGRMGRRKYALLNEVLKPDPVMDGGKLIDPPDLAGPAPLQKLYYSNQQFLKYFDAPKVANKNSHVINISDRYSRLRATLRSQQQKGIAVHTQLKRPHMKTPIHNIWMRPMPIVRARNNVRRWYASTMTRLLPPLPADEWDYLRAMICKEKHVGIVKPRAHPAAKHPSDLMHTITEGLDLFTLSRADRPRGGGAMRPHAITPKFMRKMYHRLLQLCCKVEYDEQRAQWIATWGDSVTVPKPASLPTDASLFAGVDAKGKLPSRKRIIEPEDHDTALQPRNLKGEYVRFPFFTEYLTKDHPLRMALDEWKKKRFEAGLIDEDGKLRGR